MNKKKVFEGLGKAVLLLTALGAFGEVFAKDKKEKEFEALKKAVAELQNKGEA